MVQISADTPAQIQSDAAGFFVRSAVASGKALFKNAWQIFCGNADAGVPDAERFRRFQENGDRAAGGCVFQRIGQHLFQYKQQPFFVCQHLAVQRLVFQTNLPVDELGGKTAHRLPDNIVQVVFGEEIVREVGIQTEIAQHHFHILFDALQVIQQGTVFR